MLAVVFNSGKFCTFNQCIQYCESVCLLVLQCGVIGLSYAKLLLRT
jgi:hypothetical protein